MSFQRKGTREDACPDNRRLWEQFVGGDIAAWERIFTLFYKDLYGYGLKLSARSELTRDGIHELFVELWNRRKHLGDVKSVKAYLLASLRRKLLKRLKKKRKYATDLENKAAGYSDKIQFSPEEVIIERETQKGNLQALHRALERLPDRQKEVLYLKYFNGMSYDEIEEILGINYQSIRNHVYRAVKRLRDILDENISEIAISLLPLLLPFFI